MAYSNFEEAKVAVDSEDELDIEKAQKIVYRKWEKADKITRDLRTEVDFVVEDDTTATVVFDPQSQCKVVTFEAPFNHVVVRVVLPQH